jgi:hypothetical protein
MINCRKCDFLIKGTMRHALVNNCCPACGSAVLGETHTQRMRLFKEKLMQQEFAQGLSSDLVFDISLFMLLEFAPVTSSDTAKPKDELESVDLPENSEGPSEDDYEKIRNEVRGEFSSEAEDLDEDLKIARLKRLAKEAKINKPGASVRRISGD